jgi:hypothetical protein
VDHLTWSRPVISGFTCPTRPTSICRTPTCRTSTRRRALAF